MKPKHNFRIREASQDRQPEIQSSRVRSDFKDCGAVQQRLQISDPHFDKFPTPATFACWKIRFNVTSASALNKIIQNTGFKKKISLEEQKAQKEDRFLCGRQIAYLIFEHFRVTGIHDSVENYADLFTISLRNDDIQDFDSKWVGILLSMTKIPSDDIFEGLYRLRIRESEKLKIVLELYDLEIHQKKLGPDYHRLKTMLKRSIEQDIRIKNFEARNGNYERNVVVKNPGTKQRGQRTLEDCWQWKANGQCSKGDSCSFRHDINKRAKSTQPNLSPRSSKMHREPEVPEARVPVEECFDCAAGITSKERAPFHSVKNGILQSACLQIRQWMQILGKELLCASPG